MGNKPPFKPEDSDGCEIISCIYKKITGKLFSFHPCCVKHDEDYYYGGTHAERLASDVLLRECVSSYGESTLGKIWYSLLGNFMYVAARVLGSPKLRLQWAWPLK